MELHPLTPCDVVAEEELPAPLLTPTGGLPHVIDTEIAFEKALAEIAAGTGPIALDAERASGYRYSARAYLIQLKRERGGLHLIDPIPFGPRHSLFLQLNQFWMIMTLFIHAIVI